MNDKNSRLALITGILGQDGSYMADFLLAKGYRVIGLTHTRSAEHLENIRHLEGRLELIDGDLTDRDSIEAAIQNCKPDEVYNFGAISSVPLSWEDPEINGEVTAMGAGRLLEAIHRRAPEARFFQASSAQIFGRPEQAPQTESTPIKPASPYGCAKAYAYFLTQSYRNSRGLFACNGILFNHESPRRPADFVTRKVTRAAARIKMGFDKEMRIANLDGRRDWGHVQDYVEAMWLTLQQKVPDDFVIATGEERSVQDLVETAFRAVDLDWRRFVVVDEKVEGKGESARYIGDASKARRILGWKPRISFNSMIEEMVQHDIDILSGGAASPLLRG